jgi:hypothetical protein
MDISFDTIKLYIVRIKESFSAWRCKGSSHLECMCVCWDSLCNWWERFMLSFVQTSVIFALRSSLHTGSVHKVVSYFILAGCLRLIWSLDKIIKRLYLVQWSDCDIEHLKFLVPILSPWKNKPSKSLMPMWDANVVDNLLIIPLTFD